MAQQYSIDKHVNCRIGPVKALPLVTISTEKTYSYHRWKENCFPLLKWNPVNTWNFIPCQTADFHGQDGALIREIKPEGDIPEMNHGMNQIQFEWENQLQPSARAQITMINWGEPIKGKP